MTGTDPSEEFCLGLFVWVGVWACLGGVGDFIRRNMEVIRRSLGDIRRFEGFIRKLC